MKSVAILGRQPALGKAELEALFGASNVRSFGTHAMLIDASHEQIPFQRHGGSMKVGKVLTELNTTKWREVEAWLFANAPEHAAKVSGKLSVGLSVYGLAIGAKEVGQTALRLKKLLKQSGTSVRVVPHTEQPLNTATVLHNKLTSARGWELLFIFHEGKVLVAQTTDVQDIEKYSQRDRHRPKRDSRVGMLPPKLAQIIINLTGESASKSTRILDPFCGTGVVLQEAVLMGFSAYGTDIEPRMIEYSAANLDWLRQHYTIDGQVVVEQGDATTHHWKTPIDAVAGETYLGPALTTAVDDHTRKKMVTAVDQLLTKTLLNLAAHLKPGTPLCLAIPAWHTTTGFEHLPLLDNLVNLGYTQTQFTHTSAEELLYHREGQHVARQLIVLRKD